jgi:hypothetical protein
MIYLTRRAFTVAGVAAAVLAAKTKPRVGVYSDTYSNTY